MRNITVTVAKSAGFCFGVSRAVEQVFARLDAGERLALLGPLIHNESISSELTRRGAVTVDSADDPRAADRTLVIRTHGVGRDVYARIKELGLRYIDLTCPDVGKTHSIALKAVSEGKSVFIIGDPCHPEVIGTRGCVGDGADVAVFPDARAVEDYASLCGGRIERPCVFLAQTTLSREIWLKSCEVIEKVCTRAKVFDTICYATHARQQEAADLSARSDAMIVVGGAHSSNTKKLYEVCASRCADTVWCEDSESFTVPCVADGARVGVVAGASTPSSVIKEVVNKMLNGDNSNIKIEEGTAAVEESAATAAPLQEKPGGAVDAAGVDPSHAAALEQAVDAGQPEAPEQTVESEQAMEAAGVDPSQAAAFEKAVDAGQAQVTEQAAEADEPAPRVITDDMSFADALEMTLKTLNSGDRVRGVVAAVAPNEIQVDLGTKQSGYVPFDELVDDPSANLADLFKPGDELDLFVVRVNDVEGTIMLSKRKIDSLKGWDDIEAAAGTDTVFTGHVLEAIKGGMIVSCKGVKVFVPMSQISVNRNVDPNTLLRTEVRFTVLETDRRRKRAVGSVRNVQREERKAMEEKFWETAEVGQKYNGMVKSITSYGAFVDLGGVDGMVHVTELSWNRVRHPGDVVKEGQMVDVTIKDIDREKKRISLGYKDQFENPWDTFVKQYNVGDTASVRIVKMMPFGAFAEIMPGVDGLIHISQIAEHRVARPQDELSVNQQIDVKIIDIDTEKRKISLSVRALQHGAPASADPDDSAKADEVVATFGGDDAQAATEE